jgi:hypothetical protein
LSERFRQGFNSHSPIDVYLFKNHSNNILQLMCKRLTFRVAFQNVGVHYIRGTLNLSKYYTSL